MLQPNQLSADVTNKCQSQLLKTVKVGTFTATFNLSKFVQSTLVQAEILISLTYTHLFEPKPH